MTINEIAEMAGVSRATVSRYLNGGYVSREKRRAEIPSGLYLQQPGGRSHPHR